jgi:hypothetical protein
VRTATRTTRAQSSTPASTAIATPHRSPTLTEEQTTMGSRTSSAAGDALRNMQNDPDVSDPCPCLANICHHRRACAVHAPSPSPRPPLFTHKPLSAFSLSLGLSCSDTFDITCLRVMQPAHSDSAHADRMPAHPRCVVVVLVHVCCCYFCCRLCTRESRLTQQQQGASERKHNLHLPAPRSRCVRSVLARRSR